MYTEMDRGESLLSPSGNSGAAKTKRCTLCKKRETWYKHTLSDTDQYS